MSILATSVQQQNLQSNIGRLQVEIDRLSNQVSTGKKADRFSGLGIDARRSLELRSTVTTYERYQLSISRTQLLLQQQVTALNQMDDIINEAVDELVTKLDGGVPNVDIANVEAQGRLTEIISLMNSQYQGQFLFGGRGVTGANVVAGENRPPVIGFENDAAVPDGALPGVNNYFNLLTNNALGVSVTNIGADAGGGAAIAGADRVFARLDYIFNNGNAGALLAGDAAVANTGAPNNYATWYNGDLGGAGGNDVFLSAEISENTTITYNTVIARDNATTTTSGFEDVVKALSLFSAFRPAGGAVNPANEDEFLEVWNRGIQLLRDGQEKLQQEVALLGERQSLADRELERNIEVITFSEIALSETEDVDVATVITDLNLRQSQLEATFNITGRLQNIRLSNFL
ncbi:MAG: hypothetical protein AAF213_06055 [Pseudomonadota bacterium]